MPNGDDGYICKGCRRGPHCKCKEIALEKAAKEIIKELDAQILPEWTKLEKLAHGLLTQALKAKPNWH
jgi:hypothetical protein